MDISDWRARIDAVDKTLVELLSRRAEYALKIGEIKKARGMKIYEPERERRVLEQVQALNQGPLSNDAIRRLFERIIDESRRQEREVHEKDPEVSGEQS